VVGSNDRPLAIPDVFHAVHVSPFDQDMVDLPPNQSISNLNR
jgi:hypothetical protein